VDLWRGLRQNRVLEKRGQMKSQPEIPLKVSSAPSSPLLLPSMISSDIIDSSGKPESSSNGTNLSLTMGVAGAIGDSRPIVVGAVQTQNSLVDKIVRKATRSTDSPFESRNTKKFSEHRKTSFDTSTDSNRQQAKKITSTNHLLSHQIDNTEDKKNRKIIKQAFGFEGLTRSIRFSAIESSENIPQINQRRMFEPNYLQQQHKNSLSVLTRFPQPPSQYTATAAEIALGISSSYIQNHKMGDGSRVHLMTSNIDLHKSLNRDSISIPGKEADEDTSKTYTSTDSITALSPGRITPIHDNSVDRVIVGTPSTVSTAPSSDDEALSEYKLDETSMLPKLLHPIQQNQHICWEDAMLSPLDSQRPRQSQNPWVQQILPVNPHNALDHSFDEISQGIQNHFQLQKHQSLQGVVCLCNEGNLSEHALHDEKAIKNHSQRFLCQSFQKEDYSSNYFPHHQQQQQLHPIQASLGNRKLSYAYNAAPKTSTPPRSGRNQRQQGNRQTPMGGQGSSSHQPSASLQRSSSEVLKTLLRKKACLYEPNTSRAVALVTWLVGRLLALEFGFFSRQQLQSGVHACVSNKIKARTITRTKVNRCMQIILNSCFHYIIPRSDGSEEKGDYFRIAFLETVQDDSFLINDLQEPWNDLVVDRDTVICAVLQDLKERNTNQLNTANPSPSTSPRNSPKLCGRNAERNQGRCFADREKEEASKRAVLLCFNENVRSAEDVFRCHNDFIRDTANASHLQLSAQEWGQFFGLGTFRDPLFVGNEGASMLAGTSLTAPSVPSDVLGQLSPDELGKFRTTWCTKRYEHDHSLCGFAHIEVNGGWLRRNPMKHLYKNEMCKFITKETCKFLNPVGDDMMSFGNFTLNECSNGLACNHAHSIEEINYHPLNYKNKVCTSLYSRTGGCYLGDVCPNAHPPVSNRTFKKLTSDGRPYDKRGKMGFDHWKSNAKCWGGTVPCVSPIVYASPAPISRFERQLGMPGLQNLYRRQSEVIRAFVRSSGSCQPTYGLFDDKLVTSSVSSQLE